MKTSNKTKLKDIFLEFKKNPVKTLTVFLLDVFFVIFIWVYVILSKILIPSDFSSFFSVLYFFFMLFFIILYILGFNLIYSFFKYLILEIMQQKKLFLNKLNLNRFFEFYKSNLIFVLFIFLFFLFSLFLIRLTNSGTFGAIFLFFMFILGYVFLNINHSLFVNKKKRSFERTIHEISKKYIYILFFNLSALTIYILLSFLIAYLLDKAILNYILSKNVFDFYVIAYPVISKIFLYVLFFINRYFFYRLAK